MSTVLHGPNGDPLVVRRQDGRTARVHDAGMWQISQQHADDAIAKRVRSQGVSIGSSWDKSRGRAKPTPVTDETLRLMADRNEWVRAIIKTRINQVRGVKWDVTVRDGDDPSGAAKRAARTIKKLLQRPCMHGTSPTSLSWAQFIGMFLEDLLVLDRACWEKERDRKAWICAIYPVDGATIRPNLDDRGGYLDDAYVQIVDGQVTARFGMEELVCAMDNPQTNIKYAGYGMSPLEHLVVSVTAELHASKYNASYFTKGAVPEGILSVGPDAAPEDVDAFRIYWANEVQGRPWAIPIVGGGNADPEFKQWRDNNRDMQFMEYQSWLLQKLCAVYQISQQELGQIEDVNRSTAESQDSSNDRKGIQPLLDLIADTINLEIVGEHGQGLGDYIEFAWEQVGESADQINQKFQPMVEHGAATSQEWRDAHGMGKPAEGVHGAEGVEAHLASSEKKPLPSKEDMDVLGAAHQQEREDDHRQQDAEQAAQEPGQPTNVPWQPAQEGSELDDARAQHDEESGIGPRNVGKVAPGGHDRNPALTRRQDSLDDVFARAGERLVEGLTRILAED